MKHVLRLGSFKEIEKDWKELWNRSHFRTIFQEYDWNECWSRHMMNKSEEILLLTSYVNENLVGIAPLKRNNYYLNNELGTIKFLSFIGCPHFDYHDFILDSTNYTEVLHSIIEWLDNNRDEWDVLLLPEISKSSPTNHSLVTSLEHLKLSYYTDYKPTFQISLTSNFDDYLRQLGSNSKKKYNRCMNALKKDGSFSLKTKEQSQLTNSSVYIPIGGKL